MKEIDYCEFEKLLGSTRYWLSYEKSQNPFAYNFLAFLAITGLVNACIANIFNNPVVNIFFFIHFIGSFVTALVLKEQTIKTGPNPKDIVAHLQDEGELQEFIFYLEKKITPFNCCDLIVEPFYKNWSFNIFFSGFFTLFIIIFALYRNDLSQEDAQALGSIYAIVFYFYVLLVVYSKKVLTQHPAEVTLNALKEIKKYKSRIASQ